MDGQRFDTNTQGPVLDLGFEIVDPFVPAIDGGAVLPPELPPTGGGGRRTPPTPRPDAALTSPAMTVLIAVWLVLFGSLQLTIIALGARGGYAAVAAVVTAFAFLFLGPFVAGAIWFSRKRAEDRR